MLKVSRQNAKTHITKQEMCTVLQHSTTTLKQPNTEANTCKWCTCDIACFNTEVDV